MLTGISWLYGKVIEARNSLYARNLIRITRLPAPTIAVGNITLGGTGKTPLVEYISRYLAAKGENVCIISRGYKRKNESKRVLVSNKQQLLADFSEAGDEPFELALKLLGKAYVISDRDRASAAEWAFDKFGITVFILDDAFQHRRAGRDLDIAVLDATNPFGGFKTLPSGTLRERPENLARADAIVISRTNLCDNIEEIIESARRFAPGVSVFSSGNDTDGFIRLEEFNAGKDAILKTISERAFVFCALGNPDNFFRQMNSTGMDIAGMKAFHDHHRYDQSDVHEIQKAAEDSGAKVLITTAKDAVKLSPDNIRLPCFVCKTGLSFQNEKGFTDMLDKALRRSND